MSERRLPTQYEQGREDTLSKLKEIYQDLLDGTENGIAAMTLCVCLGVIEEMQKETGKNDI